MKSLHELIPPAEYEVLEELEKRISSGKRKKWVLQNTDKEFDPEEAIEGFEKVLESGLMEKHQEKMKKIYGDS